MTHLTPFAAEFVVAGHFVASSRTPYPCCFLPAGVVGGSGRVAGNGDVAGDRGVAGEGGGVSDEIGIHACEREM